MTVPVCSFFLQTCCSCRWGFYPRLRQRATLRWTSGLWPWRAVQVLHPNQPHLSIFCCFCVHIGVWHHSHKYSDFLGCCCFFLIVVVDCQTDAATDLEAEGGSGLVKRQTSGRFIDQEAVWRKVDSLRCSSFLLPAHQPDLCSPSFFSPEKEI